MVTGSSRGIGREIERELAKKGARVAIHYRTDRDIPCGARDPGLRCEQGRPQRYEPVLGAGARTVRRLLLRGRPGLRRDRHGEFPAARLRGRGYSLAEPPRARRHPGGEPTVVGSTKEAARNLRLLIPL